MVAGAAARPAPDAVRLPATRRSAGRTMAAARPVRLALAAAPLRATASSVGRTTGAARRAPRVRVVAPLLAVERAAESPTVAPTHATAHVRDGSAATATSSARVVQAPATSTWAGRVCLRAACCWGSWACRIRTKAVVRTAVWPGRRAEVLEKPTTATIAARRRAAPPAFEPGRDDLRRYAIPSTCGNASSEALVWSNASRVPSSRSQRTVAALRAKA